MTRAEAREKKNIEESMIVASMKGKPITSKEKNLFRTTSFWRNFRRSLKEKRKIDFLTGRKLTKTWNLHHMRFDPRLYTDLDEEYFMCLNNQMHELLHICISETMKNPHFLDKLREVVEYHIKLNKNKDVREWGKETRKVTKKRK